jgi:hypothetical protein
LQCDLRPGIFVLDADRNQAGRASVSFFSKTLEQFHRSADGLLGVVIGAAFNSYGGSCFRPMKATTRRQQLHRWTADVGLGSVAVLFEVMAVREDIGIGAPNLPSPFVEVSSLR